MISATRTSAFSMFASRLLQTTRTSITSPLPRPTPHPRLWHANRNHNPCKRVRRTSLILTGTPSLIDSLFVHKGRKEVGEVVERDRRRGKKKIFIRCRKKKACQVFGVCLRLSYKTQTNPPYPWFSGFRCPSVNVSWITFDQWSGSVFLRLRPYYTALISCPEI